MSDVKGKAKMLDTPLLRSALSNPSGWRKAKTDALLADERSTSSLASQIVNSAAAVALTSAPAREPLKVYLRMRPVEGDTETCIDILDSSTVGVQAPPTSAYYRSGQARALVKYNFTHVFDQRATQRQVYDTTTSRLVRDLVQGYDSLLFTYGITNAGKTYTMQGTPTEPGILGRVLDVVFNSVRSQQASPMTIKPNGTNGFTLQSEAKAIEERRQAKASAQKSGRRVQFGQDIVHENGADGARLLSDGTVLEVDPDCCYTVMVTYAEVYNEHCYDLLEEAPATSSTFKRTSRPIAQDTAHSRYIKGLREVEVRSTEEAFELLRLGQRNRQVASTQLNYESSRSHSIFGIRLVCVPLDATGGQVLLNPKFIRVSSLSLVDLAGSERCARTKNTGQRLIEAGAINTSLMALNACLNQLRAVQQSASASLNTSMVQDVDSPAATPKKVIYRGSKLTHLFQNFFEGHGKVAMIVCVNPAAVEHDETIQVLKFSDVAQDVSTVVQTPVKHDTGLTPGRGEANRLINKAKAALRFDAADDEDDEDVETERAASQRRAAATSSSSALKRSGSSSSLAATNAASSSKRTFDESESDEGSPVRETEARKARRTGQQTSPTSTASSSAWSSVSVGRPSIVIGDMTRDLLSGEESLDRHAAQLRAQVDLLTRNYDSHFKQAQKVIQAQEQTYRNTMEERARQAELRIQELQRSLAESTQALTEAHQSSQILNSMVKTLEDTCAALKEQNKRVQQELLHKERAQEEMLQRLEMQEREIRRGAAAKEQAEVENAALSKEIHSLEIAFKELEEEKKREMNELRLAVVERIQQEKEGWKREMESSMVKELSAVESQLFLERDLKTKLNSKLDEIRHLLEAPSHLEPVLDQVRLLKQNGAAAKLNQIAVAAVSSSSLLAGVSGNNTASGSVVSLSNVGIRDPTVSERDRKKSAPRVLNHVPDGTIEPDTIMSPIIPNKKTTASPSLKNMLTKFTKKVKTPQYVVHHQDIDDNKRLTSSLYKGTVSKSISSQGISVQLTGVESLSAGSPLDPPVAFPASAVVATGEDARELAEARAAETGSLGGDSMSVRSFGADDDSDDDEDSDEYENGGDNVSVASVELLRGKSTRRDSTGSVSSISSTKSKSESIREKCSVGVQGNGAMAPSIVHTSNRTPKKTGFFSKKH
ncbi:kinesin-like protein KIF23 [Capsaspora owczarzaki ATCC 30864]|uniref:Kinesin-like protein KIF23 n=1 Tax=Capsaspora owczarzaki (strain ATCC 30864) TaxID=595528 RepID=A0A0D2WRB9_CAPO3|nr:kinesin-like protein KIF23 [Capsaspora owczarzaki ATCC 30864]KJE94425.1 kinesin-like protein KIF23 [Capsaspora owczarzaki ATCC 30864]|eukprot:XP_004346753.1 kinesin-like protein KIF23 [Capsaspora owczarzaki ATCC 30864]